MQIPKDLIPQIISYLPLDSLIRFQRVCKYWQEHIHPLIHKGKEMSFSNHILFDTMWQNECKIDDIYICTMFGNKDELLNLIIAIISGRNILIRVTWDAVNFINTDMIYFTAVSGNWYSFPQTPSLNYGCSRYSTLKSFILLKQFLKM
jgi:hypothetical protein